MTFQGCVDRRQSDSYIPVISVSIDLPVHTCTQVKAAESVSFRNYCMWIFLFHKKLHMTKLPIKVELIP